MLWSSLALALALAVTTPAPAPAPRPVSARPETAPPAPVRMTPALESARRFVQGLYAGYQHGEPDYLGKGADRVFSVRLLGLIRADQKATPDGDVGALDGDPICDCQDQQITDVVVDVTPLAPGHVRARVRFHNLGQPHDMTLDLAMGRRGWRVDDIHTKDTPSLIRYLRDNRARPSPRP